MSEGAQIAVVGAGVIGLTSAIKLRERGFQVAIHASALPGETTSAIAAAFWYPYKTSAGQQTHVWCAQTYKEYRSQCDKEVPGVHFLELLEFSDSVLPLPPWADIVDEFRRLTPEFLPSNLNAGYSFLTPLADTSVYLPWLFGLVRDAGIRINEERVPSYETLLEKYALVVNCTGLGAKEFVRDSELYPIRGQLQITEPLPRTHNRILLHQTLEQVTYVVPRVNDCLLGGTAEANNWSLEADPSVADGIRRRCEGLLPALRGLKIRKNVVGLRPARKEIRLELEERSNGAVIHNYGHGGAGYTTCWGCAASVTELASAYLR